MYRKQFRDFKTDRSVEADQKRNPTMSSRLKSAFQGAPTKPEELHLQAGKLKKMLSGEGGNSQNAVCIMYNIISATISSPVHYQITG